MRHAHRVILAASSDYFTNSMPLIITVEGVNEEDLEDILAYIYLGEIMVPKDRVQSFLEAAKILKIHNLQDIDTKEISFHEGELIYPIDIKQEMIPTSDDDPLMVQEECYDEIQTDLARPENLECALDLQTMMQAQIEIKIEDCLKPEVKMDWSSNNNVLRRETIADVPLPSNFDEFEHIIKNQPQVVLKPCDKSRINVDQPYECHVCGKHFRLRNWYLQHKVVHSQRKPFSCKTCGEKFRTKSDRQKHHTRVHPDERPYACNKCGKTFKWNTDCKKHERLEICRKNPDPSENRFHCIQCDKSYKTEIQLLDHKKGHSDEKSFPCDSDEKPYKCQYCGKRFRLEIECENHESVPSCKSEWGRGDGRPFGCQFCGKRFAQNDHLIKHQHLEHTGLELLECKSCDRSFRKKSQLQIHVKTYHSKNIS